MTIPFAQRKATALNLMKRLEKQFESAGITNWVEPELLQPADLFIALAGEDIRRRMIATEVLDDQRLVLRPEFTVPICYEILNEPDFSKSKNILSRAIGYHGEAWRLRDDRKNGAFQQAGIEWLNTKDENEADAQALKFAKDSQAELGLQEVKLLINDVRLFRALLETISISPILKKKISATAANGKNIREHIKTLLQNENVTTTKHPSSMDAQTAQTLISEIFATMGLDEVGGRNVEEIANRFAEKVTNHDLTAEDRDQLQHLDSLLSLHIPANDVGDVLDFMASSVGGSFLEETISFKQKLDVISQSGIDLSGLIFHGEMQPKQAYYTGLIFALRNPSKSSPVLISGGRYDALFQKLGADQKLAAVGCALWLDDIALAMEASS